jgi:uncharacterized protein YcgI (DUF1989 family)
MMTSPKCTYVPSDLIPSIWHVNFWLIDANTLVLSPLLTTNVHNLKPSIVKIEPELEAATETTNENRPTTVALAIMDPYEAESLMIFTASVSYNGLSSEANTHIDTTTTVNFC